MYFIAVYIHYWSAKSSISHIFITQTFRLISNSLHSQQNNTSIHYMNIIKLIITLLLCAIFTSPAVAEMYKWVDKDGNISYSDQPPFKGAQKLDAPAISTVPAADVPDKPTAPSAEADKSKDNKTTSYTYLKITAPVDDATIRNNEGNFSVSITIKPALDTKHGHYFSVLMDGKTVQDKLYVSSASLNNIDRGTHKISVAVKNDKGKVLRKSKSITVHLHRQSAIKKQPRINR